MWKRLSYGGAAGSREHGEDDLTEQTSDWSRGSCRDAQIVLSFQLSFGYDLSLV